jgi:hypothetical protein
VGFHGFRETLKDLMRVKKERKHNNFHNEDESDSEKRSSGTQK